MPNLLDLPLELFQQIVQTLVDTGLIRTYGDNNVWKLRSVCRTFAAEIEHNILNTRPKEFLEEFSIRGIMRNCLDRYLVNRFKQPRDVNEVFLTRFKNMADYIVKELKVENQQQRDAYTAMVCAGLMKIIQPDLIMHGLWCEDGQNCGRRCLKWHLDDLPIQDKLVAAIAVGAHGILAELLSELGSFIYNTLYQVQPIQMVIAVGDKTALDIILHYMETDRRLIYEQMTKQGSMFSVHDGLQSALFRQDEDATQYLLGFYQKHAWASPPKHEYDGWVSIATSSRIRNKNTLTPLLNFRPQGKSMINRQTIKNACHRGSGAMIQEVLGQIRDINESTILSLPIFIAIRSNRPTAVQACLNADADVNITAASNLRNIGNGQITPLEVAMYRHDVRVAKVLINGGATIPHISKWPTHKDTYTLLYETVSKTTVAELPELRRFKHMSAAEKEAVEY